MQVPITRSDVLHGEQLPSLTRRQLPSRLATSLSSRQATRDVSARRGCPSPRHQRCALLRPALLLPHVLTHAALTRRLLPPRPPLAAACDVMEDVAIAYGYNNLVKRVPKTVTAGKELPLNQVCVYACVVAGPPHGVSGGGSQRREAQLFWCPCILHPLLQMCELLRGECAMAGFTEILTWALCSHAENFGQLLRVRAATRFQGKRRPSGAGDWAARSHCRCPACLASCPPLGRPVCRSDPGCSAKGLLRYRVCRAAPAAVQHDDGDTAVCIGNPATAEFEVCRTSLLPGALKTLGGRGGISARMGIADGSTEARTWRACTPALLLALPALATSLLATPPTQCCCDSCVRAGSNRDAPLPVKLFEVSDVILLTGSKGCGAANCRRLVAVLCDRAAGFEVIHGLLNRVMEVLGVPHSGEYWARRRAWLGGYVGWGVGRRQRGRNG